MNTNVGQGVREIRVAKGMTQEELALKLGYKNRSTVNKVELSRNVSLKHIEKYANALDIDPEYLLGIETAETSSQITKLNNDGSSNVGERIRKLRKLRGMTQEELAQKVGYKSKASVNKIELERIVPLKRLLPFAKALDVDVNYLLGEKTEETYPVTKYDKQTLNYAALLNSLGKAEKYYIESLIDKLCDKEN